MRRGPLNTWQLAEAWEAEHGELRCVLCGELLKLRDADTTWYKGQPFCSDHDALLIQGMQEAEEERKRQRLPDPYYAR